MTLEKFHEMTAVIRVKCPWVTEFELVSFVRRTDSSRKWFAGMAVNLEPDATARPLPSTIAYDTNPSHAMNKSAAKIYNIPQDITLANLIRS